MHTSRDVLINTGYLVDLSLYLFWYDNATDAYILEELETALFAKLWTTCYRKGKFGRNTPIHPSAFEVHRVNRRNKYITTCANQCQIQRPHPKARTCHSSSDNLNYSWSRRSRLIRYLLITSREHNISLPANTGRHHDAIPACDRSSGDKDRACDSHERPEKRASGVAVRIGKHVARGLKNYRRVDRNWRCSVHRKPRESLDAEREERVGLWAGHEEWNRQRVDYCGLAAESHLPDA
jgi:hypothetical protein